MAKVYDIALDSTGDLLIVDGDFAIAESTEQHMEDLIIANKGEYKASPLVGVAISDFLNDEIIYSDELKRAVMDEFETDGLTIEKLNIASIDKMEVLAKYGND